MLVSEVIDATYLEWLFPSGVEQPFFDTLASAIDASTPTIVLSGRAESVPRDAVLEIDSELILTQAASGVTLTANERGYLGTTPATHSSGARVWIDPAYTRKAVYDAINSIIGMLFAWGLYVRQVDTDPTYTTRNVLTLPTGGQEILSVLVRRSSIDERYDRLTVPGRDWILYPEFDPPKYQLRRPGHETASVRVVYTTDFTKATSETDNLNTLGVPINLQPYLPMAVAGYLLQGKELPRVQIEEIRRLLASQGVQVGSALNIGQALLQTFRRDYVAAERRRSSEKDEPGFEWTRS